MDVKKALTLSVEVEQFRSWTIKQKSIARKRQNVATPLAYCPPPPSVQAPAEGAVMAPNTPPRIRK
jgi:hypothetical protein